MGLLRRTKRSWTPAWAVYPGFVDDVFAMYFVDVAACDNAPVTALPIRFDALLLLAATDDEGMPSGSELRMVQQLDDALTRRAGRLGGAYIGRVLSAGTARFTCYLPELPATQLSLGEDRPVQVTVEADPEWSYALQRLAPDASQRHIVDDLGVVNALVERGDALRKPRPVDHTGYFDAEAAARSAAAELDRHGFLVSVGAGGDRQYVLEATRTDPVDPPEVHKLTWTVRDVIERHGGQYDGWGCPVVR